MAHRNCPCADASDTANRGIEKDAAVVRRAVEEHAGKAPPAPGKKDRDAHLADRGVAVLEQTPAPSLQVGREKFNNSVLLAASGLGAGPPPDARRFDCAVATNLSV